MHCIHYRSQQTWFVCIVEETRYFSRYLFCVSDFINLSDHVLHTYEFTPNAAVIPGHTCFHNVFFSLHVTVPLY